MSRWSRECCHPRAMVNRPPPPSPPLLSTNRLRRRRRRRRPLLPRAAPTRNEPAGLPAYARQRPPSRVAYASARAGSFLEANSGASGAGNQNHPGIQARFEASVVPLESSAQRRNRRRLQQKQQGRRRRRTRRHRGPAHLQALLLGHRGRRRPSVEKHPLVAALY